VLGGDFFDNGVEMLLISDVDPSVVERSTEFGGGPLLDPTEVIGGGFEAVESVNFKLGRVLVIDIFCK